MRMYKRNDFIMLPSGTIYSRIRRDTVGLFEGLFCKTSGPEDYENDWQEQDLIAEPGFPAGTKSGEDAFNYQEDLRDTGQDFRVDLACTGRDGMFDDDDKFIVWDKIDVTNLKNYLEASLSKLNDTPKS